MYISTTINERGNGLPGAGDYVPGDDGELYRVLRTEGSIHTGHAGLANYVYAVVEPADWDDCAEGDEFHAQVLLPDDGIEQEWDDPQMGGRDPIEAEHEV